MKPITPLTIAMLLLAGLPAAAWAANKPCAELKADIAGKLDAAKVSGYELSIVDAAGANGGTVVGSCDGGTRKIVYARGAGPAKPKAAAPAAPKAAAPASKPVAPPPEAPKPASAPAKAAAPVSAPAAPAPKK